MLTRRSSFLGLAAAGLGAAAHPALAAADRRTPEQIFLDENRYVPLWRKHAKLRDYKARQAAATSQFMAMLGVEQALDQYPVAPVPDLTGWRAVDALDAIAEAAKDRRIVMINEAHHISGHRSFVAALLRRLRPLGFDRYACETFSPDGPVDIEAWKGGDPIHPMLGYYTNDPVFAETVREAGELGYRLSAYEATTAQYRLPNSAPGLDRIAEREEAEAVNFIDRILKRFPEARLVVHCGYSHAGEVKLGRAEWFAARLRQKTGLDPLTIEQSQSWSAPAGAAAPPVTRAVRAHFQIDRPVVVEKDGRLLGSPPYENAMDMAVFHPAWTPVEGRPGWLAADPMRRRHTVDLPRRAEAYTLLQAVPAGDPDPSVPADQYPIPRGEKAGVLWLRPGRYRLRLETPQGHQALGDATVS
jgi:hypothetical protein